MSQHYLLGQRVRYRQPDNLYRTGIEPVFLAAAVPAKPGQTILELGTGAAAALLCLATRVPGVRGVGVELQDSLVQLAQENFAANGLSDTCCVVAGDAARVCPPGSFDHAICNPPWHSESGTSSPHPGRNLARRLPEGVLQTWAGVMATRLRHRGTVTMILPAALLHAGLFALIENSCGSCVVLPLWPKAGREAKLVLLQAIKNGAGPSRILSGLTLHQPDGRYTDEADAILRHGNALALTPL